jgi:plastocyanin
MSTRHVGRFSVLALTVALFLGAAGASVAIGSTAGASGATTKDSIVIKNFMFSPMVLKVAPGAKITVTNKDSVDHTLTAVDGKFNTGNIGHDATKTFKAPTKPGTYHYICDIHQFMMGTIVVK